MKHSGWKSSSVTISSHRDPFFFFSLANVTHAIHIQHLPTMLGRSSHTDPSLRVTEGLKFRLPLTLFNGHYYTESQKTTPIHHYLTYLSNFLSRMSKRSSNDCRSHSSCVKVFCWSFASPCPLILAGNICEVLGSFGDICRLYIVWFPSSEWVLDCLGGREGERVGGR